MTRADDIPPDYESHRIEAVRRADDHIVITYNGRTFGGILADILPEGVEPAIQPGAEIIVRYHTPDSGRTGQLVHMLIRHPTDPGWAELYADWE